MAQQQTRSGAPAARPSTFDVIVVGSGASGGWAAKRLSEAGVKVALLDAGRALTTAATRARARVRAPLPQPGAGRDPQVAPHPEGLLRLHRIELRLVPQRRGGALHDRRGQALLLAGPHEGGGRAHERVGPSELSLLGARLQGKSHDGFGEDWPLSYDDVAPYYDIVEDYVGITGIAEGVPSCRTRSSTRRWACAASSGTCASR